MGIRLPCVALKHLALVGAQVDLSSCALAAGEGVQDHLTWRPEPIS
jgi:hypothetical protein